MSVKSKMAVKKDCEKMARATRTLGRKVRELKKIQKALSESENRYRMLAETIKDVLFVQDMDLHVTYVSPSVTWLFGYSVEEAYDLEMKDIMTPESYKRGVDSFHTAVSRSNGDGDTLYGI